MDESWPWPTVACPECGAVDPHCELCAGTGWVTIEQYEAWEENE